MKYLERPASNALSRWVKRFWSLEYSPAPGDLESETVVPDGCVEIIFNLGERFRRYRDDGSFELQPTSLVAGQIEKGLVIGPSGRVRLFGIRFYPAGAFPFFPFEMSELSSVVWPLEEIWGIRVRDLEDRLREVRSFDEQVKLAESALLELRNSKFASNAAVEHSVEIIYAGRGIPRVRELAIELGISQRTFERRFRRFVGLSPKAFSRIVRFQRALNMIRSEAPSVMDDVFQLGYYDQSHLINDFRQYAGMTPTLFRQKDPGMTEIFLTQD